MIALARLLTRLVGVALLGLAAAAGLLAAVFSIQGGHGTFSLAGLAHDIHLPQLRGDVDRFLGELTAHGPVAVTAAVCGAGAILLGIVLALGAWRSPRPRRIVLARHPEGSLGALRRPLARTISARVAEAAPVRSARARAQARRRRDGGRVRVIARATPGSDRGAARAAAAEVTAPLLDGLPVRLRVRGRGPAWGGRRRAARHARHRQEVTL